MFDLIIIGGSVAATTAGIYAARRGLNFKILTKEFGGEVATSGEIENWPGIIHTDGLALAEQFRAHLGANHVILEEGVWVSAITQQSDGTFLVSTDVDGVKKDYPTRAVIVATGVHPKELGVPGEKEFRNKGVTYCTTCDGPLFQDKITTVIGGGNSALESALMLADIASQVYVVNKNAQFKGDQILINKVVSKSNVKIIYSAKTTEIKGEQLVTGIVYTDSSGTSQELKTDGVFIHIGMVPNSGIVPADVLKNKFGEIMVNNHCATNVPGLFAAGDVTDVPFKQIIIAAGQGCVAALSAVEYINRSKI
ncbi:MAG: FAD-dependent oxidoreductase [Patescibacteria group bacterium]